MPGFADPRPACRAAGGLLALALAACSPPVDKTATSAVVVFLNAARTGDRATFEAHIDRPAVREDVRVQFTALPGVKELQAQLGEGMAEGALDRVVSPDAIRRLEKPKAGSPAARLEDIGPRLKTIGEDRVCLRDPDARDRCLMTFAQVDGAWKLVGVYAERQSFEPPGAPLMVLDETAGED